MIRRMMYALALMGAVIGAVAALGAGQPGAGRFRLRVPEQSGGPAHPIPVPHRQRAVENRTLQPNNAYMFCQPYGAGPHTSAPLHFKLDRDAGPGTAWTDYVIQRVQSNTTQCASVPAEGQYFVAFQPNTNNQMLMIGRVRRRRRPRRRRRGPLPARLLARGRPRSDAPA